MPIINRGDDYFAVVTYTGNGTSQTITGLRFQPDFVWIKGRSGATDHALYDSVRGVQKRLESNTTDAEATSDNGVTAFNSNGFSVGSLAQVNTNGATYVAWAWKANGSAVTNTSGTITSQVSAGASQGFSVVTYTGTGATATVGHGLGVAPAMVIVKSRSNARTWAVYHKNFTSAAYYIGLETTNQQLVDSTMFNSTAPTSSVFSVGTYNSASANTYVAYCFSEVAGFSKFGSYTGNGSADGPFVFCGFRPRWIMVKRTDAGPAQWVVVDTSRSPINAAYAFIYANLSNAEDADSAAYNEDILANGWKIRSSNGNVNTNGGTYIFAAFAEAPFKNSLAR